MDKVIIDVREKDEYCAEHIENSIHIPLNEFQLKAKALIENMKAREIILMCRSGKRANLALRQAVLLGLDKGAKLQVFEGGILKWKNQGKPTVASKPNHFPIMRQVQMVAGSMILTSVVLSKTIHSDLIWIAAFMGAGLTFAGLTGFCGMAEILKFMPWNKTQNSGEQSCLR